MIFNVSHQENYHYLSHKIKIVSKQNPIFIFKTINYFKTSNFFIFFPLCKIFVVTVLYGGS